MERPPHRTTEPILSGLLVQRIALVSLLLCGSVFAVFEWELRNGASPAEARTAAVAMIVFGEMFYLFNCRSLTRSAFSLGLFSNPWVWSGAAAMTVFQLLFTYAPGLNRVFHSQPIELRAWFIIIGGSLVVSIVVSVEKWARRRLRRVY